MSKLYCLLVLVGILSCNSKKAENFKATIGSYQQKTLNIMTSNDSLALKRSDFIKHKDFGGALTVSRQQDSIFTVMLEQLRSEPESGIKEAAALKNAALAYYRSVGELIKIDCREFEHLQNMSRADSALAVHPKEDLVFISQRGLDQHNIIRQKHELLEKAILQYDKANGIR